MVEESSSLHSSHRGRLVRVRKFKKETGQTPAPANVVTKRSRTGKMKDMVKVYDHCDSSSWSFTDSDAEVVKKKRVVDDGSIVVDEEQMQAQYESARKMQMRDRGHGEVHTKGERGKTDQGEQEATSEGQQQAQSSKGQQDQADESERVSSMAARLGCMSREASGGRKAGSAKAAGKPAAKGKARSKVVKGVARERQLNKASEVVADASRLKQQVLGRCRWKA